VIPLCCFYPVTVSITTRQWRTGSIGRASASTGSSTRSCGCAWYNFSRFSCCYGSPGICEDQNTPASHFNLFCRIFLLGCGRGVDVYKQCTLWWRKGSLEGVQKYKKLERGLEQHFGTKYGLPTPSHAPWPTGQERAAMLCVLLVRHLFRNLFVTFQKALHFWKLNNFSAQKMTVHECGEYREQLLHGYFLRWGPVTATTQTKERLTSILPPPGQSRGRPCSPSDKYTDEVSKWKKKRFKKRMPTFFASVPEHPLQNEWREGWTRLCEEIYFHLWAHPQSHQILRTRRQSACTLSRPFLEASRFFLYHFR